MEKKITFVNEIGSKLTGIINTPDIAKRLPIVILLHGYGSGKNSKTNRLLVPLLSNSEIATFRFDFTGHYDSEGDIGMLTISQGVDELKQALNILKNFKFIDLDRIGIFGTSYGGNVALWAANELNNIRVMAFKAPVSDYAEVRENQLGTDGIKKWQETGYTLIESSNGPIKSNFKFYIDSKSKNTYEIAKNIKVPCLVVHGDADDNVPINQSYKLCKSLQFGKLKIIKGANHGFKQPGQLNKVVELCSNFLIKHLVKKL